MKVKTFHRPFSGPHDFINENTEPGKVKCFARDHTANKWQT